jgi:hypothetical protein
LSVSLDVAAGRVVKRGDPVLLSVEAEKMLCALRIAEETGLFKVPRLLDWKESIGELTIEYMPGLTGIRRARLARRSSLQFARNAGEALYAIHSKLDLPPGRAVPLPNEFQAAGATAFLHGDYSGENVCLLPEDGLIPVIIDWQMTALHGGRATYGTGLFDVCWYLNNLFSVPIHKLLSQTRPEERADAFLEGYFLRTKIDVGFWKYHLAFFEVKILQRRESMPLWKLAALAPGHLRWRRYIASNIGK